MTSERDALAAWLAAVLRTELPVREGPFEVAPSPAPDARTGGEGETWCDGRHVGVRVRVRSPSQPDAVRAVALVPVEHAADRARAEGFVRAWCAVVRHALRDLASSALPDAPAFTAADLGQPWALASLLARKSLETREEFVAALSDRKHFGRYFAIPPTVAGAALERVHAVLTERPPLLRTDAMALRALTTPWNDDHPPPGPSRGGVRVHWSGVVAALELTLLDDGSVRDRKQQEIELVPGESLGDLDRVEAYLRGWRDALPEHASLIAPDEVPFTMPHDLACPAVLASHRATTRDDFRAAFARRWQFRERHALREKKAPARR